MCERKTENKSHIIRRVAMKTEHVTEDAIVFRRKGWIFERYNGMYWLGYHRILHQYGDTQGVSIYGPGEVAYDWPELVPKYIKDRIIAYSYRVKA
jgi:hypothetical protein